MTGPLHRQITDAARATTGCSVMGHAVYEDDVLVRSFTGYCARHGYVNEPHRAHVARVVLLSAVGKEHPVWLDPMHDRNVWDRETTYDDSFPPTEPPRRTCLACNGDGGAVGPIMFGQHSAAWGYVYCKACNGTGHQ